MINVVVYPQIYTVLHRLLEGGGMELTVIAVTEGGNPAPLRARTVIADAGSRHEEAAKLIASRVGDECFDMELLRAGRNAERVDPEHLGNVSPDPRRAPRIVKRDPRTR